MNTEKEKSFNEYDFISLLLPLLCKNGIHEIDEDELSRELYFYYKNPQYREIFQDICLTKGGVTEKVDIYNGMYQEKFFSGSIWWDSMRSNPLHLCYNNEINLDTLDKYLSEDGKKKFLQLVSDFKVRYDVKRKSANPMNIYGTNPNQSYGLVYEDIGYKKNELELITDGDIAKIEDFNLGKNTFFTSTYNPDGYLNYKNPQAIYAEIVNATYAIRQGKTDDKINYLTLYTEIIDKDKLEKIREIGNTVYNDSNSSLNENKPYIRKITL